MVKYFIIEKMNYEWEVDHKDYTQVTEDTFGFPRRP